MARTGRIPYPPDPEVVAHVANVTGLDPEQARAAVAAIEALRRAEHARYRASRRAALRSKAEEVAMAS